MDPITLGLLLGGGLGLVKGAGDVGQNSRNAQLNAATARYSPWTGLKPDLPVNSGLSVLLGDLMAGGAGGGLMGATGLLGGGGPNIWSRIGGVGTGGMKGLIAP